MLDDVLTYGHYTNHDERKLQPHPWTKLLTQPPRELLVPELLFTTGVTTLVAPSGEGKTTLANSLGLTVATGGIWGGHQIKPRPLVWPAGEGQDDMRPMYEAWMQEHPNTPQPKGFWLDEAVDFSDDHKTTQFIELLTDMKMAEAVIVPDALADIIGELDENSSKDINQVYRNVWRVVRANKSSFLIPHHSGWHEKRERGSTAIRAKSDIVVQITNFDPNANIITLKHHKRRSGRKLNEFSFEMKLIPVSNYPQPIPIITGIQLNQAQEIITEPIDMVKQHAYNLVKIILQYFPQGATFTELLNKTQTSKTTFRRALTYAKNNNWLIGGGRDQDYNLNPNGIWKDQEPDSEPSQGRKRPLAPLAPTKSGASAPSWPQVGPLAPSASCKSSDTTSNDKNLNETKEAESSNSGQDLVAEAMAQIAKRPSPSVKAARS